MQLQPITGRTLQSFHDLYDADALVRRRKRLEGLAQRNDQTLEEFHGCNIGSEQHLAALRMMSELLRRLEEVDHPPVWAFTSLHCLILTDGDTCRRWLASVQVIKQVPQVGESFFEVRYPLPEPWSHATAYTEDTHQAVRLVIAALGLAQPKERSQHL